MRNNDVRQKLINGTIHVVANEGLDKASTKLIGKTTNTNEVYIYRCFKDKEDMLAKTFDYLDEELFEMAMKYVQVMKSTNLEWEVRCRLYFSSMWGFLLGNKDKCLTYLRYFYSTYFTKNSATMHYERFVPLIEEFKEAFKDEADVWMILNHILNVMLDFAAKVHNGLMPSEDNYSEHVFRVIYASIKQYFRKYGENAFL